MITEVVTFKIPKTISREQILKIYRESAPKWRDNKDLIRKYFLYDQEKGLGGGVYLWPDKAVISKWHNNDWREKVLKLFGNEPNVICFETGIIVDNLAGLLVDENTSC